jgi:hypothetical protein
MRPAAMPRCLHSKRHLARQFSRFFRHPLGLGLQGSDLQFQFLPLRGGDLVDDFFVLLCSRPYKRCIATVVKFASLSA